MFDIHLKMKFHLLCGYKRSGKDTFFNKLLETNIKQYNKDIEDPSLHTLKHSSLHYSNIYTEWKESAPFFFILTKPGSTESIYCQKDIKPIRLALADMVKQEVKETLGIKFKTKELEELAKDSLMIFDSKQKGYRVLREYYIEHAMKMRAENPDHWCNQVYVSLLTYPEEVDNVIITDWRFENERNFFQGYAPVTTYRIFRCEADDENFFDVSEHSLDNEITDFLVVSNLEDIKRAKAKFPQYQEYEIKYYI